MWCAEKRVTSDGEKAGLTRGPWRQSGGFKSEGNGAGERRHCERSARGLREEERERREEGRGEGGSS